MNFTAKIKQTIQRTLWPYGTVAKIIKGHLKGYKFIVSENSGWSPILGRYESASHEIFAKIIQPGQTAFDLGANNGIHSLLFSKLVGSSGQVYSFEPLPDNIAEIEKNNKLNGITNITIVPAAVSNEDGVTTFYLGNSNKQGSIMNMGSPAEKKVAVKLLTLKTFIDKEQVKPDFLKIDIEGAESNALAGFGDMIREIKPVFFIELHNPEQDKKVGEILQAYHYTLYRVTEDPADTCLTIPFLKKVEDMTLGFPHENGIWGTILALPDAGGGR